MFAPSSDKAVGANAKELWGSKRANGIKTQTGALGGREEWVQYQTLKGWTRGQESAVYRWGCRHLKETYSDLLS